MKSYRRTYGSYRKAKLPAARKQYKSAMRDIEDGKLTIDAISVRLKITKARVVNLIVDLGIVMQVDQVTQSDYEKIKAAIVKSRRS